jgi:hypothetical protein
MKPEPPRHTHLFTLRVWSEEVGAQQREWRGRIQHISSGEVRYVRGLSALAATLSELLSAQEPLVPDQEPGG